jgi:hypothetical protein
MNQSQTIHTAPPKLIQAFTAGFNTVASRAYLLLLPIGVDLLLWFGPRLRLQGLLGPLVDESSRALQEFNSGDMASRLEVVRQIWGEVLTRFNLVSFIRTFPIGVPSLLASQSPLENPLGLAPVIEINSSLAALGFLLLILSVGFLLGCLYFNLLARSTADGKIAFDLRNFSHQVILTFMLTVGLIMLLIVLSLPGLLLLSVFAVLSPNLADIAMIAVVFILLWLLVPLVFTPHGIYSGQRNLLVAVATSVRLVRFFLPGTGIFLMFAILISQGLDILWRVPPAHSWLTLVGIFGHAFIYTSVLAASFIYFRGGMRWMVHNLARQVQRELNV